MNLQTSEREQEIRAYNHFGDLVPGSKLVAHGLGAIWGFAPAVVSSALGGSFKPLSNQWHELTGLMPGSQEFNDIVSPPSALEISQRNIQQYQTDNPSLPITKSYA